MSLVGTRPILQDELRQYELHHRARIAIKPGITGMWQVSGRSDITDFEEVVRLDTEYISKGETTLPILVKLIDARKDLSVQVHPDDDYAKMKEHGQLGKTEIGALVSLYVQRYSES